MGSPPRVRGKPLFFMPHQLRPGITPACAGKTPTSFPDKVGGRDHPRVCGENTFKLLGVIIHKGSPPRVRGKHCGRGYATQGARITPACAGKTDCAGGNEVVYEDHPRVCGENWVLTPSVALLPGSPPRVRGKREGGSREKPRVGITPACAGKTLRKWRISVVDPSPQPRSSLTSRKADASIGSQRAPCAAPV